MQMDLTTPGLLFPAISLLLLAYTNRFVVLANVIRQLSALKDEDTRDLARRQIENLRRRLMIIRLMQLFGVLSFVLCTVSMFALFIEWGQLGEMLFGISLLLLVLSLLFSLYEVQISTQAIHIELERLNR
jgi:hypothetical protein